MTRPAAVLDDLARHRAGDLASLREWLAIPSVTPPGVTEAARWAVRRLRADGLAVRTVPAAPGRPLVVARSPGPRDDGPVLVVYGHYDVVPAGAGWTTPAYRPTVRGRRLYGRGANDDKGQVMAHVAALAAWNRCGGTPLEVLVLLEGAEESGSPGLAAALDVVLTPDLRRRAVGAVVSDTERAGPDVVAVTVSQRGHLVLDVVVDVGGRAVHPGRLGGAAVDPCDVLVRLLARWRALVAAVPARVGAADPAWPDERALRRALGGRAAAPGPLGGRVTTAPAFGVLSLHADAGGRALPHRATCRVDVRLPPGADPRATLHDLRRAAARVSGALPAGTVTVGVRGCARGIDATAPDGGVPAVLRAAADAAAQAGFGRPAREVRSGGGIPAAALLAERLGSTPLLLGLGTPGAGAHGPDEHLDVPGWAASARCCAVLLHEVAARVGAGRRSAVSPARARTHLQV